MRRKSTARVPSFPPDWTVQTSDDYEFIPLRLPPDVTRVSASVRLSIEAEFRGWEISRVRLYPDGTRKVLLRRRRSPGERVPVTTRDAGDDT